MRAWWGSWMELDRSVDAPDLELDPWVDQSRRHAPLESSDARGDHRLDAIGHSTRDKAAHPSTDGDHREHRKPQRPLAHRR
jgi:hypothetical protein